MAEIKVITTPSAKLAPNQMYLNLMFNSLYRFTEIVANDSPDVAKMKMNLLTPLMISYVISKTEKERLKAERAAKLEEIDADRKTSTERREQLKFEANCEMVSEIVSLLDDVIGVVERQVIMETLPMSPLEKKYFPDGNYESLITTNDTGMNEVGLIEERTPESDETTNEFRELEVGDEE